MGVRIIQGDCLDALKALPDESVHCVVTSPPYWGLRDYQVEGQIGLEPSPAEYVDGMVAVFNEVRRVLRGDGTLWLNLGDSYTGSGRGGHVSDTSTLQGTTEHEQECRKARGSQLAPGLHAAAAAAGAIGRAWVAAPDGLKQKDLVGIPWMVAFALRADGWYLRQDIIWAKPNPMPESVTDRCTKSHEYLFLLSKSSRYYFDAAAIAEPMATGDMRRPYGSPGANALDGRESPQGNGQPRSWKGSQFHTGKTGKHQLGRSQKNRGYDKPYTGESTKDYAAGKAQDASATKARIVDAILAGDIVTRNKRSVWTVTTKPFSGAHFATFPPDLIEPCILAGCPRGGVVLDPFGGAGTTGLVADRHGRDAILIELNPEYVDMARDRIRGDSPLFAEVS